MKPNKYQEAIEHITTPAALKEKTRQALLARTRVPQGRRVRWGLRAVAAAVLLFFIGFSMHHLRTGDDFFVTDMISGQHLETVILQDGALHFNNLAPDDLTPPIRLAPNFPLRRTVSLDEYQNLFPADIPDGLSPPTGDVTAFFTDPTGEPTAILGSAVYELEDGGVLTVSFTNDASLLYLPVEIGGSELAGIPLGLGFSGDAYYGAYLRDGHTFLLRAEGMEQRAFIQVLYAFLSD